MSLINANDVNTFRILEWFNAVDGETTIEWCSRVRLQSMHLLINKQSPSCFHPLQRGELSNDTPGNNQNGSFDHICWSIESVREKRTCCNSSCEGFRLSLDLLLFLPLFLWLDGSEIVGAHCFLLFVCFSTVWVRLSEMPLSPCPAAARKRSSHMNLREMSAVLFAEWPPVADHRWNVATNDSN